MATLTGRSVLVVEDEAMIALDLEGVLARLGCTEFHTAARVEDAQTILDHYTPAVALLDLNIRGELVFPIAKRLDELDVPCVIVTGHGGASIPKHWLHRIVLKPYDPEELAHLVETLLAIRHGLQEA
jgi:DNA-binding NtrC family response regulator